MESILITPKEMRRKGSHFMRTQPRIRKNWSITWRQAVLLVLQHLNGSAAVMVFISWGYQASLSAFSATDAHGSYCSKSIESLTGDLRDPLISLCASVSVLYWPRFSVLSWPITSTFFLWASQLLGHLPS